MSFADLLKKSGLVEDVPDLPKKSEAPIPTKVPAPVAVHMVSVVPHVAYTPAANPEALKKLQDKLQVAMQQVPNYGLFAEQYELLSVIPDESLRFVSALKSSKTTVAQLSADLDHLIAIMQTALDDFTKKFDANSAASFADSTQKIDTLKKQIADKEAQISALTTEVAAHNNELGTEKAQIQAEEQRLHAIKEGFEAAHAQVIGQLNAQKAHFASTKG